MRRYHPLEIPAALHTDFGLWSKKGNSAYSANLAGTANSEEKRRFAAHLQYLASCEDVQAKGNGFTIYIYLIHNGLQ